MGRAARSILLLALLGLLPLLWVRLGWPWMALVVSFVLVPVVDLLAGGGAASRPQDKPASKAVRWVPRTQLLFQVVLLGEAVRIAPTLSGVDLVVFAIAVGTVTGGLGITVAHELCHRPARIDRAIAKALLVLVAYGHFFIEHVRGHHRRVATPEDPASAPLGMSAYPFVVRSLCGGYAHAWYLERRRLAARGLPPWHASNWVLWGSVASLALLAVAWWIGGTAGLTLGLVQAAWAVTLLEVVNYIEHYGLTRRRVQGHYEPVGPQHAWNSDYRFSNWMLFNLQLHADHHLHAEKAFERLVSLPQAPQLPAGYPLLVPVALVPPLWFRLMNARAARAGAAG